jgi:glycosyltransferase involved in cell wall biosynthesis
MPKISIIIPTYNRELLLRPAIQSVLNQTFQDFEIIVVDDASDVPTQELLSSFEDIRIRLIRHDHNKGEAASRNTGIVNANGEFLAFLDDDDEWLPDKLALQVDLLEKASSRVGAVYTGMVIVNLSDNKVLFQNIPTKRGDLLKDMLFENVIGTPSKVLIRRSCIQKVGLFDENLNYYVDYDFFLRFAKHFHFDYTSQPLVKYHIHEENLTKNMIIIEKGLEKLKIKYSGEHGSEKIRSTFYSNAYLIVATNLCYCGNLNKGRELLKKAIKYNPFEWRLYFNILTSLLGKNMFILIGNIKKKIGDYVTARFALI